MAVSDACGKARFSIFLDRCRKVEIKSTLSFTIHNKGFALRQGKYSSSYKKESTREFHNEKCGKSRVFIVIADGLIPTSATWIWHLETIPGPYPGFSEWFHRKEFLEHVQGGNFRVYLAFFI